MFLRKLKKLSLGFSMTELIIALLLASLLSIAGYNYFKKQERRFVVEKMSGDVDSLARIAFYLIGRDIRRAGSNPSQAVPAALSGTAAAPIPLPIAEVDRIEIKADLNGDGDTLDTDEDITYVWNDSNSDGIKDQIRRDPSLGDLIVIENVTNFALSYIMASGAETVTPSPTSLIRKVRVTMTVSAGRLNPETKQPITQTFSTIINLRNFQ